MPEISPPPPTDKNPTSKRIAFLVLGVSGWGKVGYKLWDSWAADEAGEA